MNASDRHLSLLLPCVLQSAYKLRCGIKEYERATGGNPEGLGPLLCSAIAACNNSAKMAMRTIMLSGESSLEEVLVQMKSKSAQQWLVGLNCEGSMNSEESILA